MPEIDLASGVFRYETPEDQAQRRAENFRQAAQRILERHQQEQQAQDAQTFSQNAHNYLEQTMQEDQRRQDFRSAAQGILDQAVQDNTGARRQQLDQADVNAQNQTVTWPDGTKHWAWEHQPDFQPPTSDRAAIQAAMNPGPVRGPQDAPTFIGPNTGAGATPEQQQQNQAEYLPGNRTQTTGILTGGEAEQISGQNNRQLSASPMDIPIVRTGVEQLPEPLRTGVETTLSQFTPANALASMGLPGGVSVLPKLAVQSGVGAGVGEALHQYAGAPGYSSTIGAFAGPLAAPGIEAGAQRIGRGFAQDIREAGGLGGYGKRILQEEHGRVRYGQPEPAPEPGSEMSPADQLRHVLSVVPGQQAKFETLKTEALTQKSQELGEIFASGGGLPEAYSALKDWSPQAPFKPPIMDLSAPTVNALSSTIRSSGLPNFKVLNALRGLDNVLHMGELDASGRVIRPIPSEQKLLEQIFPGMGQAIEQRSSTIRDLPFNALQESYPGTIRPQQTKIPAQGDFPAQKLFDQAEAARVRAGTTQMRGGLNESYPGTVRPQAGELLPTPGGVETGAGYGGVQGQVPDIDFFDKLRSAHVTSPESRNVLQRVLSKAADIPYIGPVIGSIARGATSMSVLAEKDPAAANAVAYALLREHQLSMEPAVITREYLANKEAQVAQVLGKDVSRTMEATVTRGIDDPQEAMSVYNRALDAQLRKAILRRAMLRDGVARQVPRAHVGEPVSAENIPASTEVSGTQAKDPAFQGLYFRDQQALNYVNAVTGTEPQFLKPFQAVAGLMRLSTSGLAGPSHWFIQGLPSLVSHPEAWAQGVVRSMQTFADSGAYNRWLENNQIGQWAREAGQIGPSEVSEATQRTGIGRIPVVGPLAQRVANIYGTFTDVSGAYVSAAVANASHTPPYSEAWYRIYRYGSSVAGKTNLASLGVSGTQRGIAQSFLAYSYRYSASVLGTLGHTFDSGATGADARRTVGLLLAGGAAGFYGAGKALGLSDGDIAYRMNPRSGGKFFTLPIAGGNVGFGGMYRALIQLGGSLSDKSNYDTSSLTGALGHNPITVFLQNRTSPLTSAFTDAVHGKQQFGGSRFNINDLISDPKQLGVTFVEGMLPFPVQTAIEAPGGLQEKATAAGASMLGGHYNRFGLADRYNQKQSAGAFGPDAKPYSDENSVIRANNIASDSELAQQKAEQSPDLTAIKAETEQPLIGAATALNNNVPGAADAYRKARGDALSRRQALTEQALKDANIQVRDADRLSDQYQSIQPTDTNNNGFIDPEDMTAFFNARDTMLAQIRQEDPKLAETLKNPAQRFSNDQVKQAEQKYQTAIDAFDSLRKIPKYLGMSVDEAQAQDKFNQEVTQKATEVSVKLGYNVSDSVVADALAQQEGDPGLAAWYRALNSRRDELTNPAYTQFLQANQSKLETFFPDYYGTGFYQATGQIAPKAPNGLVPLKPLPKGTLTPLQPTGQQIQEQQNVQAALAR